MGWNYLSIPKLPLKFGNGEVIPSHILLGIRLLIHAIMMSKLILVTKGVLGFIWVTFLFKSHKGRIKYPHYWTTSVANPVDSPHRGPAIWKMRSRDFIVMPQKCDVTHRLNMSASVSESLWSQCAKIDDRVVSLTSQGPLVTVSKGPHGAIGARKRTLQ